MIGITLREAQKSFFDRPGVQRKVDRAAARVLSKFGAFVRRRAKSSIRKRKKVSEPGQPPSSHTGLLKGFIFFAYEAAKKGVVIGPTLLNSRGDGDAPRLLEHGGDAMRERGRKRQSMRVYYRPRPFMQPAFEAELPTASALWAGAVR